jgi:electron transport complex protein RnfG
MMLQSISKNAVILGLFAIATAATLALTNDGTLERIQCNKQHALESSLLEVMPQALFDNALLHDVIVIEDPSLGRKPQHLYRARLNGKPAGVVIEASAPDGYGGAISLLVGIDANGNITGVRVVPPHNETPGLGDKIELKKSPWVLSFNGKSLHNTPNESWAVKKDGGVFDSFTGATITPRAVVAQVQRALGYYQAHADTLFATPTQTATDTESCDG